MATVGPSELRSVSNHAESAQSSRSPDPPTQSRSCRTASPNSLRGLSSGQCLTRIQSPGRSNGRYSHTSSVFSPKSPSRASSPDSSLASPVKEPSATGVEAKELQPDLPKAPQHFSRVFSIPKALFEMHDSYREWHFSIAPKQNVQMLLMDLNEETSQREKAEQQVRYLTERLSSGAEPGPKIQPSVRQQRGSEVEKHSASKPLFFKERDPRRRGLIENKENKSLEERFKLLVDWSDQVQEDNDVTQDGNKLLHDLLDEASKEIRELKAKEKVLEGDKARLEKQLEQSRNQRASRRDSYTQTEGAYHEWIAELQRGSDRLGQENTEMRSALEQPQDEDSPSEEQESQAMKAQTKEEQTKTSAPGEEIEGADNEMGGIARGRNSTTPQDTATENEASTMPVALPVRSETARTIRIDIQQGFNKILIEI
ncbi:uncharacterized protein BKA55DRAFT_584472 [Fusarium redolens]|uniref:Uncharacterized protein n=1 Tax=Fusarium redolens TaxID=48865 RepID=A0A9P9FWX6_FUSRE|nr:uncharacterized protein BKA55DRAFT_584472 [Fusarium redolens]KAH7224336.1 hypothetical protein BKA55DRAFT_584472 [Fusarium redolens]